MSVDQYISSGVLELYAAHALAPEEMREVEAMAEKHARIREELDAISEGLKRYAELYAPARSEGLYDKIIHRINAEPVEAVPSAHHKEAPVVALKTEKQQEKNRDSDRQSKTGGSSGRLFWLIAASVLLLVSVGVNFYLYNKYNDAQDQLLSLQAEKNTLVDNNKALKTNFDKAETDLKMFTDHHNKMVMMKGMPISPGSEVMVVWNTNSKEVFVDVHALPAAPEGMQYQLWAIDKDGKPVDAGMLTPYKEQTVHGLQPMKKIVSAVAFAITLEKRGGSPIPSIDKMYVKGEV
jgi:hypothetical protein